MVLAVMYNVLQQDYQRLLNIHYNLFCSYQQCLYGDKLGYDIKTDNILGIIDKNPAKHGTYIEKYKCYAPEDINKLKPKQIIISIIHYVDKREKEVKKFVKENCSQKIEVKRMF